MLIALAAAAAVSLTIGNFAYAETADPMTDQLRVRATLDGDGGSLTIACNHKEGKSIYVLLNTDRFLVSAPSSLLEDMMSFRYRVGQNEPFTAFSSYRTTQVVIENAEARAFAQRLAGGSLVTVSVMGVSGTIEIAFPATGAAQTIAKVAERCGDRRLIQRLSKSR